MIYKHFLLIAALLFAGISGNNLLHGAGVPPAIVGTGSVCPNQAGEIYSITAILGNTYQWEVTGGVIVGSSTGTTITVNWGGAGTGTVSVTEYDSQATEETALMTVAKEDIIAPVVKLPASPVTIDAGASCGAVIPSIMATVTDNCTAVGNFTITQIPAAGTPVGIGITSVTVIAVDEAGNSTTENIEVRVVDNTPPVITATPVNVTAPLDANCQTTVPDFLATFTATDNCTAPNAIVYAQSPAAGTVINGVQTVNVTLTATDAGNNHTSATLFFTTNDATPPTVVTKPAIIYIDTRGRATLKPSNVNNGSFDGCPASSLSFTLDRTAFTCADIGAPVTVTLTATDGSMNSATGTAEVTVIDNIAPVVNVKTFNLILDPETGTGTLNTSDIDGGSYDNCEIALLSVSPNEFGVADIGPQTVTLTAEDSHGNQQSKAVTITVSYPLSITNVTLSNCYPNLTDVHAMFSATPSGGKEPYTYLWGVQEAGAEPFSDITLMNSSPTSTELNPYLSQLLPIGNNHITLTITDANGVSASTVFAMNNTSAVFNNVTNLNSEACAGEAQTYSVDDDNSDPDKIYTWDVPTEQGYVVSNNGTNEVSVIWYDGVTEGTVTCYIPGANRNNPACVTTVINTVTILPNPTPFISGPAEVCEGTESTYTVVDGTYASYSWTVSGGIKTAGGSPSDNYVTVLWEAEGTGNVDVTVTSTLGCQGTTSSNVIITPEPTVTLTSSATDNTSCEDESVTFTTNVAGGASAGYIYEFFVNSVSVQDSPLETYTSASTLAHGDVVYVAVTTPGGCSVISNEITSTVLPLPTATLTGSDSDNIICYGDNITFTAGGGIKYIFKVNGVDIVQDETVNTYSTSALTNGATVEVTVTNSNGCSDTESITITVNELPEATLTGSDADNAFCAGESVTFTATAGGTRYVFMVNGGIVLDGLSNTFTTSDLGDGAKVSVEVFNTSGCSAISNEIIVTVHPLPDASLSSNYDELCFGESVTFTALPVAPLGVDYMYDFLVNGASVIIGTGNTYTISTLPVGEIIVNVIVINEFGCSNTSTSPVTIRINPLPEPVISGFAEVCESSTATYSVTNVPGNTYSWDIVGGTIQSGQNTNEITVAWDAGVTEGTVDVIETITATGCSAAAQLTVTINPLPAPVISGSAIVCESSTATYSVSNVSGNTYTWNVVGGTIQSGANTNEITVVWDADVTSGTVVVTETVAATGCSVAATQLAITVNPLPEPVISGFAEVCESSTATYSVTNVSGNTYSWDIVGGTIQSGQNTNEITVAWNTGVTEGTVDATETITATGCSAAAQLTVTVNPLPTPVISGSAIVCEGSTATYSVSNVTGNTYSWSVVGGTIQSGTNTNEITVVWDADVTSGTVDVTETVAATSCSVSATQLTVTVNPLPEPVISGSVADICGGSTITYSVVNTPGNTYNWTIVGGTIQSGQNTNEITVIWNAYATEGTVDVTETITATGCSAAATQLAVTVNPLPEPAGIISGDAVVCQGNEIHTYSVPEIANATTYEWYYNGASIVASNEKTVKIKFVVNPTSGILTVRGINACGEGVISADFAITVNLLPGAAGEISGLAAVCQGQTGVVYSVAEISDATSYVWTLPTGATIASGDGTNSIVVDFDASFTSGTISAHGTNSCGTGTQSTVNITGSPVLPISVSVSADDNVCDGTSVTFTASPVNEGAAPVYQWYVNNNEISGENTSTYTYIPANGDEVLVVLTAVESCVSGSPATSNVITMTVNEILPISVSVSADANPICEGTSVIFTASPVNGGATPVYEWYVNGTPVIGETAPTYTYTPTNGDAVYVKLTAVEECIGGSPATSDVITMTVNEILPVSVSISADANPVCKDASVTFTAHPVNEGAAPSYQWYVNGELRGEDSPAFAYIPQEGDIVWAVLTSSEACASSSTVKSNEITMNVANIFLVKISWDDVNEYGGNDGSFTVEATGAAPYEYSIDGVTWQPSGTFNNLIAGIYNVKVRDVNLCGASITVTIKQPVKINVSQTDVLCFGASTGSIIADADGGTPSYEYSIDGGVTWQSSGTFSSLAAGTYTVSVRDQSEPGKYYDSKEIIITQPASAVSIALISKTDILCYGANTGTVTVDGSGGVAPYRYSVPGREFQSSGTLNGLLAGSYTVTVQDANLCTATINVELAQPGEALYGTIANKTDVSCLGGANGSVTITAAGGVAPYMFSINGATQQTSGTFGNLATGSYSVDIYDINGCVASVQVSITELPELAIDYDITPATCPDSDDGSISLTMSGGSQPYAVIWSDGNTSLNRDGLLPGTYSVVATDVNGCATSATITVGNSGIATCIEIQEIITPNNDGFNDTWKIKNIDMFPDAEVLVYNRWGELVFRTKNISGNEWDGTSKGKQLPTDSYHYILRLNDGSKPKSGVISIIR